MTFLRRLDSGSRSVRRWPNGKRLWFPLSALAILAALLAAIVIVEGGFDDPRPWSNGWVRLLTLGATFAALAWAVCTVGPRIVERLKLAAVVSALIHICLVVLLCGLRGELLNERQQPLQIVPQVELFRPEILPETAVSASTGEATSQSFAAPVETVRPAPEDVFIPRAAVLHDTALSLDGVRRRVAGRAALPAAKVEVPAIAETPPDDARKPLVAALGDTILPRKDTLSASPLVPAVARPAASRRAKLPVMKQVGLVGLAAEKQAADMERSHSASTAANRRRPADAFAHRVRQSTGQGGNGIIPMSLENDATVELGLEFLARIQLDDGRWKFNYLGGAVDGDAESVDTRADAAATGLALLAFLGAGHDHFGGRYERTVRDGLEYLIRVQRDSGELFPEEGQVTGQVTRFYGHGIATLALCEAYGMTGDPELYQPAQQALDYLVATQHPVMGGWRYNPGANTDLSVTAWQLTALRSGELAGLSVRWETLAHIRECLEKCRIPDGDRSLYCYNPWASPTDPLTSHGRKPSTVMTSVGLMMQLHLGDDPRDPRLLSGAEQLLANLPDVGESPQVAATGTLGNPRRDTYYWYYGTQVMYYVGGERWAEWSGRLEPLLAGSQTKAGPLAGSWDPLRPVPDKWATYGGRLYVTALNLLSLEIPNRHLPLDSGGTPQIAERPK